MSKILCLAFVLCFNALWIDAQTTLNPEEECESDVFKNFGNQLVEIGNELEDLQDTASSQELRDIAGNSAQTLANAIEAAKVCTNDNLICLDDLGAKTNAQFADLDEQICALETGSQEKKDGERITYLNQQASKTIDGALKALAQCGNSGSTGTEEEMGSTASM